MSTNRQLRNIKRAALLSLLLCTMLLAWPQKRSVPATKSSNAGVLLERAKQALDAGEYASSIALCDDAISLLAADTQRAKWYDAVKLRTQAQVTADSALNSLRYVVPLLQKQTRDDSITAKLYGLAGFACLYAGQNDQGVWYYEQSLAGLLRHHCKMGVGTAFMNIGYALKEQDDFRAAIPYYLTALPLLREEGNLENLSESLINLGDMSRYIFEFDSAETYYRRAFEEYPERDGRLSEHLGWIAANQHRYAEALTHFRAYCRHSDCAADVARIMGQCYEQLGDAANADRQFRLALENAGDGPDSARVHWYIGQTLLRRQQPEAALLTFQQGLHGLFPALRPDDPADNPRTALLPDFWPAALFRGKAQAQQQLYTHSGKTRHLQQALADVNAAIAVLDTLRAGLRNEGSGQDAVDYTYGTYETGIRVALDLERAEPGRGHRAAAYDIAEHARSNVLKANLQEKDLRKNAQISDSLLWQEKSALAAQAYWEEAGRPDSLLAATRRLERVRSDIAAHIPLLQKARTQTQHVSVTALQDALQEGELLLQYFWGDSAVVVFAIGKGRLDTHVIPRDAALEHAIDTLRIALTQWHLPAADYAALAAPVYRRFCAPLLKDAGAVRRLIVVPDGPLWSVPFEALTIRDDGRFLVEDCAVSYHWSGALWWQARTREHPHQSDEYGGFAPQYPAPSGPLATLGAGLADLPEARAAVQAAGAAWGGRVWQGREVDKALFQREAGRFGILHLAMHGLLDRSDRTRTGLAFPGPGDTIRLLNTLEISQMDLSAQLAVLTACNTGSGVVYRGEGVMSLSRAFALAGCPALTANLWEVPSRETNDITAAFLDLLRDGQGKDEALRAAKLDFLHRAEPERRHPFFWAGQVLVGNEQPLQRSMRWGWWVLGLGVLGGLGWLGRRHWARPRPG